MLLDLIQTKLLNCLSRFPIIQGFNVPLFTAIYLPVKKIRFLIATTKTLMSAHLPQAPITESSNSLTSNIDVVDSRGILSLLQQSDAQLFSGYLSLGAILDQEIIDVLTKLSKVCEELLREDDNLIVMSGSGTSGRIASFCARSFNRTMIKLGRKPCFYYLISGLKRKQINFNF